MVEDACASWWLVFCFILSAFFFVSIGPWKFLKERQQNIMKEQRHEILRQLTMMSMMMIAGFCSFVCPPLFLIFLCQFTQVPERATKEDSGFTTTWNSRCWWQWREWSSWCLWSGLHSRHCPPLLEFHVVVPESSFVAPSRISGD